MASKPAEPTQSLAVKSSELFPVLAYPQDELSELIADNLGGQMPKLQRVPWPTGGNLSFNIDTDEGPKSVETLTGLVVHHVPNRLFWVQSFEESGGGQMPECSSPDGLVGYGKPDDPKTGAVHPMLRVLRGDARAQATGPFNCRMCPLAKFVDDDRPRCRETHPLFIILKSATPDEINLLPIIVSVPPSSLTVWSDFSGRLLQRGISFRRAIIEVGLKKDTGGPSGKIVYSKMKVRRVGLLTSEEFGFMRSYAEDLAPLFARFRDRAVETVDVDSELNQEVEEEIPAN